MIHPHGPLLFHSMWKLCSHRTAEMGRTKSLGGWPGAERQRACVSALHREAIVTADPSLELGCAWQVQNGWSSIAGWPAVEAISDPVEVWHKSKQGWSPEPLGTSFPWYLISERSLEIVYSMFWGRRHALLPRAVAGLRRLPGSGQSSSTVFPVRTVPLLHSFYPCQGPSKVVSRPLVESRFAPLADWSRLGCR